MGCQAVPAMCERSPFLPSHCRACVTISSCFANCQQSSFFSAASSDTARLGPGFLLTPVPLEETSSLSLFLSADDDAAFPARGITRVPLFIFSGISPKSYDWSCFGNCKMTAYNPHPWSTQTMAFSLPTSVLCFFFCLAQLRLLLVTSRFERGCHQCSQLILFATVTFGTWLMRNGVCQVVHHPLCISNKGECGLEGIQVRFFSIMNNIQEFHFFSAMISSFLSLLFFFLFNQYRS